MLRVAGSWSNTPRRTAPIGSASSSSLVLTKVNVQISPHRSITRGLSRPLSAGRAGGFTAPRVASRGSISSVASGSPGDDEIGGEDEGDELVMVDRARWDRRV